MNEIAKLNAPSRLEATPRHLRVVATPPRSGSKRGSGEAETIELKVTFGQLALIYKSLQAVKTLGALAPQDELLNDTLDLVDLALDEAV
jgi:hypothetical protein